MKLRFLFSLMLGASLAAGAQGYQDGVDNYNAGRNDIAKEILTNTLNAPSTDKAVSYYYLGCIDFADKNVAGAKANFEKGVKANPSYPYNVIGLGEVLLKSGNKSEAQKMFDQAMKSDKKNTAIIAAVARAYWNVDPVAYAKDINKWISKAFKESKNTESAVYMLQGDMVAKTDPGEAAGKYEMAIEQDKAKGIVNREAYVKYAHVYNVHNRPLVIQKLEELNELEPNSGLAQRELAEVYYDNRQYGSAWKSYEKYVRNPNHFRRDEQRYSGLLYSAGEYNESIKWAEQVLAQDPSTYQMYRILMLDYKALGNDSLAMVNGEKLFAYPDAEFVLNDYIVYGESLLAMGKAQEAVAVYEKGMKDKADDEASLSLLPKISAAYQKLGDNDKAIAAQMRYLDSGAAAPQDYYGMFQSYFNKGRACQPGSPEATEAYTEAGKYLDKALEKAPNHIPYIYRKAVLSYVMNGNKPDQTTVSCINSVFDHVLGMDQAGQDRYKAIMQSCYTMMGDYYVESDKAKAIEYYEKALSLSPDNATLQNIINNLKN